VCCDENVEIKAQKRNTANRAHKKKKEFEEEEEEKIPSIAPTNSLFSFLLKNNSTHHFF
jgi:hypothetical protein